VAADGVAPPFVGASFDRVLIDAPCSGLGALRRRADARWRIRASDVSELASIQHSILMGCAPLVKVGGLLVYSVCTVLAEESIDHPVPAGFEVVGRVAQGAPSLDEKWREFGHGFRVLAHEHDTDGMVLIRYRRRS
jgi:16S rRNA (cytosine967-C5)-methyltransferase